MPDTARPIHRHPSDLSQNSIKALVSMSPSLTTRHQWFTHVRLPGLHLPHHVRLFHDAHHHGSFTAAARGGLTPAPACRCRRTYLHLHNSTTTGKLRLLHRILPIIFRTHQCDGRDGDRLVQDRADQASRAMAHLRAGRGRHLALRRSARMCSATSSAISTGLRWVALTTRRPSWSYDGPMPLTAPSLPAPAEPGRSPPGPPPPAASRRAACGDTDDGSHRPI
jgi:hypothetical protein